MKLKLQLKAAMPTFDTTPAARPLNLHGTTEKKGTRVMGVGEIGEPGGEGGWVMVTKMEGGKWKPRFLNIEVFNFIVLFKIC